jgi:hypothetical protein
MAKQEREEREASAVSADRSRQRYRDRELATRQGQPWVADGLTSGEARAAQDALGVDPVPAPDFVPAEFPRPHRRERTPRQSGRPAPAQPLTQIRRLPTGEMDPPGSPELPPGHSLGTVIGPTAFGRRITQQRFRWLLSCAAAEERLLEDARYPGRGRYSQTVDGHRRSYVWLGPPADLDTFNRYASANYEPPAGMATGRVILMGSSGEPDEEREADWLSRRDADRQALAARDTSRWAICTPDGHALVTKPGREEAEDALARWSAKSDAPLHLEEVVR